MERGAGQKVWTESCRWRSTSAPRISQTASRRRSCTAPTQRNRAGTRVPIAVAVAVARVGSLFTAFAVRRATAVGHVQFHQALGHEADHVTHDVVGSAAERRQRMASTTQVGELSLMVATMMH